MALLSLSRRQINSFAMWALGLTIGLAPLALGANRPLVWPAVLLVLSLSGLVFSTLLQLGGHRAAFRLREISVEMTLFGLFLGFCIVQILPLNGWLGLPTGPADVSLPQAATISVAPQQSLLALITWLNLLWIAYLSLQAGRNQNRSLSYLKLLFFIVGAHAFLGFALFFLGGDAGLFGQKWAYLGALTGAFVNRNTFATFLATGAVIGTALVMRELSKGFSFRRALVVQAASLCLVVAAVLATGSRMGVFVTLLGMSACAILMRLRSRDGGEGVGGRLIAAALIVLFVVGAAAGYGALTLERLGSVDKDADVRFELYKQTWTMIENRPLAGFGGGSFELAFPMFHKKGVSFDWIINSAHNSYLGLWADYGLLFGSLPWLVALVCLFRLGRAYVKAPKVNSAVVVAICVILVACLHALVDFSLEIPGYALLFSAVVANGIAQSTRGSFEREASA